MVTPDINMWLGFLSGLVLSAFMLGLKEEHNLHFIWTLAVPLVFLTLYLPDFPFRFDILGHVSIDSQVFADGFEPVSYGGVSIVSLFLNL